MQYEVSYKKYWPKSQSLNERSHKLFAENHKSSARLVSKELCTVKRQTNPDAARTSWQNKLSSNLLVILVFLSCQDTALLASGLAALSSKFTLQSGLVGLASVPGSWCNCDTLWKQRDTVLNDSAPAPPSNSTTTRTRLTVPATRLNFISIYFLYS